MFFIPLCYFPRLHVWANASLALFCSKMASWINKARDVLPGSRLPRYIWPNTTRKSTWAQRIINICISGYLTTQKPVFKKADTQPERPNRKPSSPVQTMMALSVSKCICHKHRGHTRFDLISSRTKADTWCPPQMSFSRLHLSKACGKQKEKLYFKIN